MYHKSVSHQSINPFHQKGDSLVFSGIIILLIIAPFAFGSVHTWGYTLIEMGVFSLVCFYFISRIVFSNHSELEWIRTPVNGVLFLFICFICLQMIPLPGSLIALISPQTYTDKMQMIQFMEGANNQPSDFFSRFICLTYCPHPSFLKWLKLLAYAGMFFLVINTVKSRKQINILIYILIFLGMFEAVYAVVFQVARDTPVIWWWERTWRGLREPFHPPSASGTFIGSNHFAFYMEMMIPLSFGFLLGQKKKQKKILPASGNIYAFSRHIVNWFAPDSPMPKMMFLFLGTMFMGGVLLFSRSRGGILSLSIAMFIMSVLFFFKKHCRIYGLILSGFWIITLIYANYLGIDSTIEKFRRSEGLYLRLYTSQTTLPMFSDYPITGVGWGNFAHVYSQYIPKNTPEGFEGTSTSGHAHNDWFEAGIETGFTGCVLMLMAFIGYLFRIVRIWLKRKDFYAIGIGAGIIVMMISTGLHSFFDFSMHIPANPLIMAAIMGLGYAAVHCEDHKHGDTFFYDIRRITLTPVKRILLTGMICLFFLFITLKAGRHFLAEIKCPTEWNSTLNLNWNPDITDIQKAISLNPANAEYHIKLANYHIGQSYAESGTHFKASDELAIESLKKAVRLNPVHGNCWYILGERYSLKRHEDESALLLADQCFDMAMRYEPTNADMLCNIARYWTERSTLIPEKNTILLSHSDLEMSSKAAGIQKFQQIFQQILEIDQSRWEWAVTQVWKYHPDPDVVSGIVPADNKRLKELVSKWIEQIN